MCANLIDSSLKLNRSRIWTAYPWKFNPNDSIQDNAISWPEMSSFCSISICSNSNDESKVQTETPDIGLSSCQKQTLECIDANQMRGAASIVSRSSGRLYLFIVSILMIGVNCSCHLLWMCGPKEHRKRTIVSHSYVVNTQYAFYDPGHLILCTEQWGYSWFLFSFFTRK